MVVAVVVTAVVGFALSTSRGATGPSAASVVGTAGKTAPPANYVAMGSSFAAGPGEGPVVDRRCLRTGDNYPHQVAAALGLKLIDVTCSGSTAAELLTGPERKHSKVRPQVEAVDQNTSLVTITTGGNDLDFVGRIISQACNNMRALGLSHCGSGRMPPPPPNPTDYGRLEQSLVDAVEAVQARSPKARVILVDYTPVVAIEAPPCQLLPLLPWEVEQDAQIAAAMSAVNQRVADRTGAQHLTTASVAALHSACAPEPWIRGFGSKMVFHPNAAGKTGIADLVVASVR
ncbi:hypothetical protein SCNU_19120 [Gordonia neofelifaecis NRRL B-59395]|uniref:SGNH hydrolase-type esterase domain-containing protein n=1 Tax=Gordonia neofelifaecis NRRL B-59395 TaxID=644548 RepID=F1YPG9_9ACTN|nr:hypothetical protein SCNU_19120 [Gordonia neofelifaecis NRRL B-59395]